CVTGRQGSVRPYPCLIENPSDSIRAITVGEGGAAAVVTWIGGSTCRAAGAGARITRTVGAPLKWVTRSSPNSSQMRPGSTWRRHTWVAPAAVTAHGKHQPLQWNI